MTLIDAPSDAQLTSLLAHVSDQSRCALLYKFITELFAIYTQLHFTYLEINPLVIRSSPERPSDLEICILDLAARLDQTAEYEVDFYPFSLSLRNLNSSFSVGLSGDLWISLLPSAAVHFPKSSTLLRWTLRLVRSPVPFPLPLPLPFSCISSPPSFLSSSMFKPSLIPGASLKLTVLNPKGRIWTMVAGGGASVIYSDTIADLGGAADLANYGEYSGAPSTAQTYGTYLLNVRIRLALILILEYAKTILSLMTREFDPLNAKVLLIGGGIANFTNVAATFKVRFIFEKVEC